MPHLQALTDRPTWLNMPGSRAVQQDLMALHALMGSCATACSCLLYMLSHQMPRQGERKAEKFLLQRPSAQHCCAV